MSPVVRPADRMIFVRIHLRFERNFVLNQRRRQMHRVLKVDVVVGSPVDQQIIDVAEIFDALFAHDPSSLVAGRIIGRSRHVAGKENRQIVRVVEAALVYLSYVT